MSLSKYLRQFLCLFFCHYKPSSLVSPLHLAVCSVAHISIGILLPMDFFPAFKELIIEEENVGTIYNIYNEANIRGIGQDKMEPVV